jgi:hypothetical protein
MTDTLSFGETGPFTYDAERDEHRSSPLAIPLLNRMDAEIVIVGYLDDPSPAEFGDAIHNLLRCDPSTLLNASDDLFCYYTDIKSMVDDDDVPNISRPDDAWACVRLGRDVYVERRSHGDKRVYATIECGCDWEEEHGLQLVLRDGLSVCKLGPYDGHLTNADAYGDPSLESVVYRSIH